MVLAAVDCILELGFYRASTNEIAKRAGVTWGVLQHHFGTREALMLAVLEHGSRHFTETVENAEIEGSSAAERLENLLEVLSAHYGSPEYLAYLQVLLNLDHDPKTSREVRSTMRRVAESSNQNVRRLLRSALGSSSSVPDVATTTFLALRGFALSQQLLETMSYDSTPPQSDRMNRRNRLIAQMLAAYVEEAT